MRYASGKKKGIFKKNINKTIKNMKKNLFYTKCRNNVIKHKNMIQY